ncbi:MAG: IS1595 family transposase [Gammaproteobacteria bacterium]|nr:IS1595 family transposase [Gammaproteobacteria bacterium]
MNTRVALSGSCPRLLHIIRRHRQPRHALGLQLCRQLRERQRPVHRLPAGHRHRVVVEDFVGNVDAGRARRIKGKRVCGAFGKTAVFGIFKRNGQVQAEIVPDCQKATLQAIIRARADTDSTIDSDGWGGYDGLVDMGYRRHLKVAHGHGEWARGAAHINGIEGFWGFAKSRLAKFRGMSKHTFYLHLKECEFRFNHRHDEVYETLLESCRKRPSYLDSA